jgi:hypothetical protein
MYDDRHVYPSRAKLFPNVVDNAVDNVVAVDACLLSCAVVVVLVVVVDVVAVVEQLFVVDFLSTLHSLVAVAPVWIVSVLREHYGVVVVVVVVVVAVVVAAAAVVAAASVVVLLVVLVSSSFRVHLIDHDRLSFYVYFLEALFDSTKGKENRQKDTSFGC